MALAALWVVGLLSRGSCYFLDQHCYMSDPQRITCLLQGDSEPQEPGLEHILAQTLSEMVEGHTGCPQMSLSATQIIELYLLPCDGMFDTVRNNNSIDHMLNPDGSLYHTHLTNNYFLENCNQSKFTISHALFDDFATTKFSGGIHLKSTVEIDYAKHPYDFRPMIQRAADSFYNDGTCNVINNGMHDVGIKGVELNNQDCVDTQVPASQMAGALKKYGPDTM